jgi:hypothetical protein
MTEYAACKVLKKVCVKIFHTIPLSYRLCILSLAHRIASIMDQLEFNQLLSQ